MLEREAPGIAEDAPAWALATSTRESCLGQDCPDLADCFVFRARQAAQAADFCGAELVVPIRWSDATVEEARTLARSLAVEVALLERAG